VIELPDGDVLSKVVALLASPAWTPGPQSSVSIKVRKGHQSNTTAEVWQEAGPLLADALRAGLTSTRVTGGRGGRHTRRFDVSFDQSNNLPDLTTPEGYGRIIEVLRRHRWQGEAQIELAYDDHLIFWSTDRGTAQDAYFALHGAKSREPNGRSISSAPGTPARHPRIPHTKPLRTAWTFHEEEPHEGQGR
ncbi:MAG: L,D-transpeptidase, partial [Luteococcus sp.]|uniref:L,D-transpeptidase n=1 Tax=Luteococcus sp. TaxID=1969402 RepID=UPI002649125B